MIKSRDEVMFLKFSRILKLLSDILVVWKTKGDPDIEDVEVHSSSVKDGDVFICRKGEFFDSHDVAHEVVEKGARALICERMVENVNVPVAVVSDTRMAEAILAFEFYSHPYEKLLTFGVTGTNGKTTVAHMLHHILGEMDMLGSMIGTVYNDIAGRREKTENTTPGALYIARAMKETLDKGGKYFVLEISSHALAQKRVYSIKLDAAALTNITRDHLDFHKDFEDYKKAKFMIFDMLKEDGIAVINEEFFEEFKSRRFRKVFLGEKGAYRIKDVEVSLSGTKFTLEGPFGKKEVSLPIIGEFNAQNATIVIAMLYELGFDIDEIIEKLKTFPGVEGRMQKIKEAEKAGLKVFVDFAHSPDALKKVLLTSRKLLPEKGRVIIVFGAGGRADKGKRKLMGEVVSELADVAIVTNDDPRGEDPQEIINDIVEGIPPNKSPLILENRRNAIETALTLAGKRDIVIIAGRGHEDLQVFGPDLEVPFKDADVVREIVRKKAGRKR